MVPFSESTLNPGFHLHMTAPTQGTIYRVDTSSYRFWFNHQSIELFIDASGFGTARQESNFTIIRYHSQEIQVRRVIIFSIE